LRAFSVSRNSSIIVSIGIYGVIFYVLVICRAARSRRQSGVHTVVHTVAPGCLMVLLCSLFVIIATPSHAIKRQEKVFYGTSTVPYWTVGSYSSRLSRACQKRLFGQKRKFRYVIGFVGEKGRGITGIATSTWNLYDPVGLAAPRETYHFFNDGYSNCAVYVSPQPRN